MTTTKHPPNTTDIVQTQKQIIEAQRAQIKRLEEENSLLKQTEIEQQRRIEFLQDIQQEYNELRSAFGNGNVTYNQAYATILTRRNAQIAQQTQFDNFQRRSKIEAEEAARRDAEVKQVLADNPNLVQYCDKQKAKAEQDRDKMLKLATEFYSLDIDKAEQYAKLPHKAENSAVKHLILEIQEGKAFYYECEYCGNEYNTVGDFERHCYNSKEDHEPVTISDIQAEATGIISKANAELQKDIDTIIKNKAEKEYKARLAQERAEQAKAAKDLPFVRDVS